MRQKVALHPVAWVIEARLMRRSKARALRVTCSRYVNSQLVFTGRELDILKGTPVVHS